MPGKVGGSLIFVQEQAGVELCQVQVKRGLATIEIFLLKKKTYSIFNGSAQKVEKSYKNKVETVLRDTL